MNSGLKNNPRAVSSARKTAGGGRLPFAVKSVLMAIALFIVGLGQPKGDCWLAHLERPFPQYGVSLFTRCGE